MPATRPSSHMIASAGARAGQGSPCDAMCYKEAHGRGWDTVAQAKRICRGGTGRGRRNGHDHRSRAPRRSLDPPSRRRPCKLFWQQAEVARRGAMLLAYRFLRQVRICRAPLRRCAMQSGTELGALHRHLGACEAGRRRARDGGSAGLVCRSRPRSCVVRPCPNRTRSGSPTCCT